MTDTVAAGLGLYLRQTGKMPNLDLLAKSDEELNDIIKSGRLDDYLSDSQIDGGIQYPGPERVTYTKEVDDQLQILEATQDLSALGENMVIPMRPVVDEGDQVDTDAAGGIILQKLKEAISGSLKRKMKKWVMKNAVLSFIVFYLSPIWEWLGWFKDWAYRTVAQGYYYIYCWFCLDKSLAAEGLSRENLKLIKMIDGYGLSKDWQWCGMVQLWERVWRLGASEAVMGVETKVKRAVVLRSTNDCVLVSKHEVNQKVREQLTVALAQELGKTMAEKGTTLTTEVYYRIFNPTETPIVLEIFHYCADLYMPGSKCTLRELGASLGEITLYPACCAEVFLLTITQPMLVTNRVFAKQQGMMYGYNNCLSAEMDTY